MSPFKRKSRRKTEKIEKKFRKQKMEEKKENASMENLSSDFIDSTQLGRMVTVNGAQAQVILSEVDEASVRLEGCHISETSENNGEDEEDKSKCGGCPTETDEHMLECDICNNWNCKDCSGFKKNKAVEISNLAEKGVSWACKTCRNAKEGEINTKLNSQIEKYKENIEEKDKIIKEQKVEEDTVKKENRNTRSQANDGRKKITASRRKCPDQRKTS